MEEKGYKKAVFAGGCFWCMQPPFDNLKGVISTRVGYTGGALKNPDYEEVSSGTSGHAEAIEVVYDSRVVTYEKLLDVFWQNIDPTTLNQQFADRGHQYRTAIFYLNEDEKRLAEASKENLKRLGKYDKPIVTEILPASQFYNAEGYHQEYYKKNPDQYERYKLGSGRAGYLKKMWGK
ncbi:MAG: peptide-methionine (S)-S-oxide reductase MsrA [Candidatus Omnitrophica bacterium]|nr:peptide-methionine (S)-S-oxide reductase MsrA [Candidatus Omnitrophota bacterium]